MTRVVARCRVIASAATRSSVNRRTGRLKPKAGAEPQGRREAAKRPLCLSPSGLAMTAGRAPPPGR